MDRMACVDLPALPLQLLLQKHPDWAGHPVAVVDHDKPQGIIVWINERARALRIVPGMRYAAGLALSRELRAAEVSAAQIADAVVSAGQRLAYFTPFVEHSAEEPGVYWLDASGLERLHGSLGEWAELIRSGLKQAGYAATVVVGFSRFGTYGQAKSRRGVIVFETPEQERQATGKVPLERLAVDADAMAVLRKLGIRTVGDFVKLPAEGMARRFGDQVHRFHRLASGYLQVPFQPERPLEPLKQNFNFDYGETDLPRLMAVITGMVERLLARIKGRNQALASLTLDLFFDRAPARRERLCPAAPTLDTKQILELIQLRLQSGKGLPDGVEAITLEAQGATTISSQQMLFAEKPRRDLDAANRALALIRAELGENAVRRARLREGHLPEGAFVWEDVRTLKPAEPRGVDQGFLVRRFFPRPLPLLSRARNEPDGWLLQGVARGRAVDNAGPYIISGGWWRREIQREYYFVKTDQDELLWVFYDRHRRRWYLQGRVE